MSYREYKTTEKHRIYSKKYYEKNREKRLGQNVLWQKNNQEKVKGYLTKWRKENRDKINFANREYQKIRRKTVNGKNCYYKYKFGIGIEKYNELLLKQNGVCAICGEKEENKQLSVDHNHKTNVVRGLLCGTCNRGLGLFREDYILLVNASEYLKNE